MRQPQSEIIFNALKRRFQHASDAVLIKLTERLQGRWGNMGQIDQIPTDIEGEIIMPRTTLLFVDDNVALVESATRYMSEIRPEWRFLLGHSLTDARRIYNANSPDAAVLDVELPDGNGLDFLVELKRERPQLPVVMISGLDHAAMRRAVLERGGYAFLAKPFAAPTLVEHIESAISEYRNRFPEQSATPSRTGGVWDNPNALLLRSASEKYLVSNPEAGNTKKSLLK